MLKKLIAFWAEYAIQIRKISGQVFGWGRRPREFHQRLSVVQNNSITIQLHIYVTTIFKKFNRNIKIYIFPLTIK